MILQLKHKLVIQSYWTLWVLTFVYISLLLLNCRTRRKLNCELIQTKSRQLTISGGARCSGLDIFSKKNLEKMELEKSKHNLKIPHVFRLRCCQFKSIFYSKCYRLFLTRGNNLYMLKNIYIILNYFYTQIMIPKIKALVIRNLLTQNLWQNYTLFATCSNNY